MTVSGLADAPPAPEPSGRPRLKAPGSARTNPVVVRAVFIVTVLSAWEVLADLGVINELFVSKPSAIAWAAVKLFGSSTALTAIGETLTSMVLAFVIGTGLGMLVGIVLGLQHLMRQAYLPIVMMLMGIPKSVFLPIFVLLFGLGGTSAVVFGSLLAFVHVTVNVIGGVDLIEPKHLTVARAFRGSAWKRFVHVILPGASPGLFTAIWHGLRNAFVGVVVAELFASTSGIGSLVKIYSNNFQTAEALALVSVISAAVILVGTGWNRLERRLTRWRSEART
jgi:ABC-type nitrate/sulfonate/bicarbonate transport system permease component